MHTNAGKQKHWASPRAQTIMTYRTLHDVPFLGGRDAAARTSCWADPARAAERGIRRGKRTELNT